MPPHALLGVTTLVVSAIAVVLSILSIVSPRARRATRWPLLIAAVGAAALATVTVTGRLGHSLWDAVKAAGTDAEIAAAGEHAHGSDALTVALAVFAIVLLSVVWKALSPRTERWSAGAVVAAIAVGIAAIAVVVTGAQVLLQALEAVAAGHASWSGN